MSSAAKIVLSLAAVVLLLYLSLLGLLYVKQDSLLFFPSPTLRGVHEAFASSEITVPHDGVSLRGWFLEAHEPNAPTIAYYGGNGEELSRSIQALLAIGNLNLLMVNYRGYGDSEGMPSETAIKSDAKYILQTLIESGRIDPSHLYIMGRSLGTGVATAMASEFEPLKLVLISPYDSIASIAADRFPFAPVSLLIRHPFRSIDYAAGISAPTLVIKAEHDAVVPHGHTDALISAWQAPVQIVTLPGTNHNSIYTDDFYNVIREFLEVEPIDAPRPDE